MGMLNHCLKWSLIDTGQASAPPAASQVHDVVGVASHLYILNAGSHVVGVSSSLYIVNPDSNHIEHKKPFHSFQAVPASTFIRNRLFIHQPSRFAKKINLHK